LTKLYKKKQAGTQVMAMVKYIDENARTATLAKLRQLLDQLGLKAITERDAPSSLHLVADLSELHSNAALERPTTSTAFEHGHDATVYHPLISSARRTIVQFKGPRVPLVNDSNQFDSRWFVFVPNSKDAALIALSRTHIVTNLVNTRIPHAIGFVSTLEHGGIAILNEIQGNFSPKYISEDAYRVVKQHRSWRSELVAKVIEYYHARKIKVLVMHPQTKKMAVNANEFVGSHRIPEIVKSYQMAIDEAGRRLRKKGTSLSTIPLSSEELREHDLPNTGFSRVILNANEESARPTERNYPKPRSE